MNKSCFGYRFPDGVRCVPCAHVKGLGHGAFEVHAESAGLPCVDCGRPLKEKLT